MDGLTATLLATGFAFAVSASLGVLLGSLLASSRFWGDVWEPVLFWLYGIPKLIFYPIVILVFGIGFSSTMAFGVLSGLLPVVIIVFASVRSVPLMHLKVAKVYGLSRRQVFREVVVPVVLPSLVTAVRYGFSLAFSGVVLAEMFAAREGLGQVLMGAMFIANKGQLFGVAAVLVVVGFGVNGLLLLVQRRVAMRFGGLATAGQRL